ncbi:oligosaccharide flippase family protein [Halalkalibacter flavus]|uniref:oligosaccharide flippase family protein n=1 Tax=Halalkalibacter flavus TaxID=3090668 RepID=UPI002FCBB07A
MEKSLKSKTVKGIKWTTLNTIFNSFSYPLYQVVLAVLLLPQDFAYIAIISLFVTLSVLLNNLGIGEAVIQKDEVNSSQLSTLFYFSIIISIIIASILFVTAPYIESYYGLVELETIIQLIIITIVLNGSSSIFRVCLQKNLLFKEYSLIQIVRVCTDMAVTIVLILLGYGILGYVYGTIVATILNTILLVIFALKKTEMKILLHFNIKDAFPFLNFGVSISLKKILTEVSHRIDEIIIGGMLAPEVLGVYFFGKNLILQLRILITNTFGQVLLPVFSKIKKDIAKMREVYNRVSYFVAMISFPVFLGISLTAHLFIPIFFGDEWIGSVGVIRVLSIVMIFLVLTANIATSLLYAINRPGLVLSIDIVTTIIYIILLYLFGDIGLNVILMLYSFYIILKTTLLQFFVSKGLEYGFLSYIVKLKKIFLSTTLMTLIILVMQLTILKDSDYLIQLFISVLFGAISYIAIQLLIDRKNTSALVKVFLKRKLKKAS